MMVRIPQFLSPAEVARCREALGHAAWVDGRATAGHHAVRVKRNLQLPKDAPEAIELGNLILAAIERNALFMSAVLPRQVLRPMFNRYDASEAMTFGSHVDNAVMAIPGPSKFMRTDVSSTLFISQPDEYDGGELVVEDTYGSHAVKLPAGDMIVYPGTSVHHVRPVTRGTRMASFFWTQSMIRDGMQRNLLFDLDQSIMRLSTDHPEHPSVTTLTATYHNMLRLWAEL